MGFFDAAADLMSSAGDAVEAVVDAVVDTVEDVVDTAEQGIETAAEVVSDGACNTGVGVLCQAGNIVGGVMLGFARAIEGLAGHAANVIRGIGRMVGNALRLNGWGFLNALMDTLIGLALFGFDLLRILLLAPVASSFYDLSQRAALKRFIEARIVTLFANTPDRIGDLRTAIGLDSLHWGIKVPAHHHTCFMDTANTPLWKLHQTGVLDLYALGGFRNRFANQARTYIKPVDGLGRDQLFDATRSDIDSYLATGEQFGGRVDQLRIYALTDRAAAEKMSTVRKKCHKMGIEIEWSEWTRFSQFNNYDKIEIEVKATETGGTIHPYHFNYSTDPSADFLNDQGLRNGNWADECELQSVCVFHFRNRRSGGELNGVATGVNIQQSLSFSEIQLQVAAGESFSCSSPSDRDDRCFICIKTDATGNPRGTATFYRDTWPHWFSDYVPGHEAGHWLGLCHWGHIGFQKIMVTVADNQGSGLWNWDMIWRTYAYGFEPQFTWQDARNTWRYILDQWAAPGRCL